jgi:hypothetical protein
MNLKSLAALILILAGWITDPIARGVIDSSACAMECCTDDGSDSCEMHYSRTVMETGAAETSLTRSSHFSTPCRGTCSSRVNNGRSHYQPHLLPSVILAGTTREGSRIEYFGIRRDVLLHSGSPPRSPPHQF